MDTETSIDEGILPRPPSTDETHEARRARRHSGIVRHIVSACAAALLYITAANAHATEGARILIEYVEPGQPAHRPLYDALKEHRVLERVRDLLSPVRWPQPLRLEVKGCDGDSNAW